MSLDADLATLHHALTSFAFNRDETLQALRRVKAEIARLREDRDSWIRAAELSIKTWEAREQNQYDRAEAAERLLQGKCNELLNAVAEKADAEREVARLREGLREIISMRYSDKSEWVLDRIALAQRLAHLRHIARVLLAEDGAACERCGKPLAAHSQNGFCMVEDGAAWGPDHPSYDEMGQ